MHIISPGQFELYYTRFERRIHRLLAQLPKLTVIAAAALIFLLVYGIQAELTDSETQYLMFGGFISVRLMREGMLLAIPLSLISLLVRGKWRRPFQFLALTAVWLANTHWYFRKLEMWPAQVLCLASVPILCLAGYVFLRTGTAKRRLAAAAFTFFYMALAGLVSLLLWQHAHELTVFWRLRTHLIYLGFMMMSLKP